MTAKHDYVALASVICVAALLGGCAPTASNDTIIATSVAQTVAAQETERAQSTATAARISPTLTPLAAPTRLSTKMPPTAPPTGSGNIVPCYRAEYVADVTIPDGTIVSPGATFWKTWSVKNTGSR